LNHIFLLVRKNRGMINASSMRYFETIDSLEEYIKAARSKNLAGNWYVYRVYSDGQQSKLLSQKESEAIGI